MLSAVCVTAAAAAGGTKYLPTHTCYTQSIYIDHFLARGVKTSRKKRFSFYSIVIAI